MKKAIIFALILGVLGANLIFVAPVHAIHDEKPLCYLAFWRDGRCEDEDKDKSPAPAPTPTQTPTTNHSPVWIGGQTSFSVKAGDVLQFSVSAFDPDNDPITYGVSFLPIGASFNNQTFYWNPTSDRVGTYLVQFNAHDGKAYAFQSVTITVTNSTNSNSNTNSGNALINNKPVFANFNPPGRARVGELYSYDVNAVDADNDILTYAVIAGPTGLVINGNTGLITWTPTALQTQFNYAQIAVSDGKERTLQDFYIFVDGPNIAPTPAPQPPINPSTGSGQVPREAKIIFSDIKFEEDGGEVWVSWKTNIPSGSRVVYDTTSQADRARNFTYANATPDDRDLVTDHRVKIGKLEIGAVYYMRLVSKTDQQVATSNEIVFILLEGGRIQSLFGASLLDILGPLFTNATFLWLIIISLAAFLYFLYRKIQKMTSPL